MNGWSALVAVVLIEAARDCYRAYLARRRESVPRAAAKIAPTEPQP